MMHDTVLVFSKTWGAVYLFVFFWIVVLWTYWPANRKKFEDAARQPMEDMEDKPWQ